MARPAALTRLRPQGSAARRIPEGRPAGAAGATREGMDSSWTTVGLDLGTARTGLAVNRAGGLEVRAPIAVDVKDLDPAVEAVIGVVLGVGAGRLAVEWSPQYAPHGVSPAGVASMGRNHEIMAIMLDRIERALRSYGVAVVKLHPNTVRSRLGVRREEGERTDAAVRRAVGQIVGPAVEEWTTDQVDAAAAALADAMGDPRPVRKGRRAREAWYQRKHGGRYQRTGHPSDQAFEALLAAREVVE